MIKFSREKVLLLHQLITEETGGDAGVRDFGLLDSALENIYQTFDGPFVDGNKRIGMYVMLSFLQVNGIHIHPTNEEVARVGLAVASGAMSCEELLAWIVENSAE